jgi:type IV pilus assembly protein PilF
LKRTIKAVAAAVALSLMLVGCVTTVEGPGGKPEPTNDERVKARLDLARGYLEKGDTVGAVPPLEEALEIEPRSPEAHVLMALVYQSDGRLEDADKHFKEALRYGPKNAMVNNNYGAFLYSLDRFGDAERHLRLAAEDPGYSRRAQAYENLGLTQLKLGDTDGAMRSFQRALRLGRTQPRSNLELAEIYLTHGNNALAQQYFEAHGALAQQTPRSLWIGIRLSQSMNDEDGVASYALLLRNLYPGSEEYALFQATQESAEGSR